MITVKELYKSFGVLNVLNNINCTIKKGEIVAVIGPSGTGKGTFLRCLNFLEMPDRGIISLDGYTVDVEHCIKKDIYELREKSTMIFQNHSLFANKTVLENLTLPLIIARKMPKKEAQQIGEEILEKIGLYDKAKCYPSELSGGQQQRAGIGRAMALDRKIMLLDEPTSALDPELSGEVLELIRKLANTHDTTMVIVTHEMAFAERIADRIFYMNHGVIVEEGPARQLLSNPQKEETKKFLEYYRKVHRL